MISGRQVDTSTTTFGLRAATTRSTALDTFSFTFPKMTS
jgi:hypothetical protein